jgi:hypothetical protein
VSILNKQEQGLSVEPYPIGNGSAETAVSVLSVAEPGRTHSVQMSGDISIRINNSLVATQLDDLADYHHIAADI